MKDTELLHAAADRDPVTGALSVPIYNASTYAQEDVETRQAFDYSRSGNPTRKALESTLAALERGSHGFAFASGMAAISSTLLAVLRAGDHVVACEQLYGGSHRLLSQLLPRFGVSCSFVDSTDLAAVERAVKPSSKVLFLESPSNPLLKITDIAGAARLAKAHGLVSVFDNTFMSPYLCRPLALGVDIVVHSATKFLGGHSDLIAGAVVTATPELGHAVYFAQNTLGAVLGPQDSWLLLRGIKTLGARMKAQQESAKALASWLVEQPWAAEVYYPGLPGHPGRELLESQADGPGAILSFKADSPERARRIMKAVKIWAVAVSLGGVEAILSYPAKMSHAAVPREERERLGVSDSVIRLSPGLEDVQDLIEDLRRGAETEN